MIKGKAKLEFGTGDIRITAAQSGEIGAVCLRTEEPHKIGKREPVESSDFINEAEVIMTFTRIESIDALMRELQNAKELMQGELKGDEMQYDELFDFDAFMAE